MSDELLDREALLELLGALADRLRARGVRASVYVIGGAAISLVFDARRATRDIDSVVLEGHGPLMEEVQRLGRERGLPGSWLNEQAAMYVSRCRDDNKAVVFDHPNLVVAAASPEHLLAMKLQAARAPMPPTLVCYWACWASAVLAERRTCSKSSSPARP